MNKTKGILVIGLFVILCAAWALAPLWVNPCIPARLSEDEIEQIRAHPSWDNLNLEQQVKQEQLYREEEIPCGAESLPTREKLEAANWEGRILHEISFLTKPLILRFELVDVGKNGHTYYFKGYTFFLHPPLQGICWRFGIHGN
jgi:hypothetical protein